MRNRSTSWRAWWRSAADHPTARVGLRLNPALDADTHPHLATGAAGAKFGIALADLPAALALLRSRRPVAGGLGAHIGSAIEAVEPFAELARHLADAVATATAAGLAPDRIDLGGGLAGTEPEELAAVIGPVFSDNAA